MNDTRNLILAIVLSLVVLLGWGAISRSFFPTAEEPSTKIEDGRQVPQAQPGSLPAATPVTQREVRSLDDALRAGAGDRLPIDTPSLKGSINLVGAQIDDLVLERHTQTIADDSAKVRLFAPASTENGYLASFGWTGQGGQAIPGPTTRWVVANGATKLSPGQPVVLRPQDPALQAFELVLNIDDNYLFTVEQKVANHSGAPIAVRPLARITRIGQSKDPHDVDNWTMHVGPVGVFNGTADYENDYDDVRAGAVTKSSTGGFLGFSDKYWLSAIIPTQSDAVEARLSHEDPANSFLADVSTAPVVLNANQTTSTTMHLFAGAKEVSVLEAYEDQLGTPIDKGVDWGWYEWFMRPIFSLLLWLFHALGNFGFAIICLTLIVRLLMYPIAQKQFRSMGKMRAIQPKTQALQERYKDDKPRMQQEMLKLYREEKVNPAAGCLPILIQIPIFYALYRVLIVAVEMRHQPFVGWIQDLSAPDPLSPVNLFGFLPFDPPGILHIGILPILVGITMFLQQKLNPPIPDPVQRKIFGFLPWILMFVMAPFAAGLQLYWVTNNLLSIAQQRLLYARHPEMKLANDKPAKAGASPPPPPPAPDPNRPNSGRLGRKPSAK